MILYGKLSIFWVFNIACIFNLCVKALYWVLQSFLSWDSEYYLHNFVAFLLAVRAMSNKIWLKSNNNARLTDIFGITCQEPKDLDRKVVFVFGIKVNTNLFAARISGDKLNEECELALARLNKWRIMFFEDKTLTGLLLFCAKMVHLGWYLCDVFDILWPNFP